MATYKSLLELLNKYEKWVCSNPSVVADIETYATWSSYFIVGKINKSPIVSEFIYSLSKLLTLYNDRIIEKSLLTDKNDVNDIRDTMKLFMTVIHYCEVFFELFSRSKWGNRGKWNIATILQSLKCILSLILLYKFKQLPILSPPIPRIQRKKMIDEKSRLQKDNGFILKRSGRFIVKVEGAPSALMRNWQYSESSPENLLHGRQTYDSRNLRIAESLYLMKPIIHLGSMACFGSDTWNQWLIPFGIDLAVLKLYNNEIDNLSYQQKLEISKRKLSLILYLLRNPVYEKYSKDVIAKFFKATLKSVPLAGFICNPILQYLNYWQDIYFYMWSI